MSKPTDSNKKPVIMIALLTAACLLGDSMLYIVLPVHWQEAGLSSLWEVGILLSVNRLVRLPLNPIVGWAYGKMSSRTGLLLAGILATATTFSYGLCKGFILWIFLRSLWGLAWTFLRLGAYFTILEVSSDTNRGHYMGLYNGLYRLGSLGGMLFGGFLADQYGIGPTAIGFSAVTLVAVPLTYRLLPGKSKKFSETGSHIPIKVLANSHILWTLLTGLIIALVYQGVLAATLSYLVQIHNSSTVLLFGASFGAASLAGILQALRWAWEPWLAPWCGKLSDSRFSRRGMLILALLLASALFAVIPLPISLIPWLILILAILLTATILTTIIDAIACDVAVCSLQKVFMTAYSFAIDIGAALGPLIGYALNGIWGPNAIYWGVAVALAILAIKWFIQPADIYKDKRFAHLTKSNRNAE